MATKKKTDEDSEGSDPEAENLDPAAEPEEAAQAAEEAEAPEEEAPEPDPEAEEALEDDEEPEGPDNSGVTTVYANVQDPEVLLFRDPDLVASARGLLGGLAELAERATWIGNPNVSFLVVIEEGQIGFVVTDEDEEPFLGTEEEPIPDGTEDVFEGTPIVMQDGHWVPASEAASG